MNYSRQREQILTALKAHPVHPTADELWHALKAEDPRLSLATVYRNLNQMVQLGLVRKITGLDAKDHFDHTLQPHDHLFARRAGVFRMCLGRLLPTCALSRTTFWARTPRCGKSI